MRWQIFKSFQFAIDNSDGFSIHDPKEKLVRKLYKHIIIGISYRLSYPGPLLFISNASQQACLVIGSRGAASTLELICSKSQQSYDTQYWPTATSGCWLYELCWLHCLFNDYPFFRLYAWQKLSTDINYAIQI